MSIFLDRLCFVPECIHFFERRLRRRFAVLCETRFDMRETANEFAIGGAERSFRIELQMPRDVGHDEQHVAELFFNCAFQLAFREPAGRRGHGGSIFCTWIGGKGDFLEFGDLFFQLVEHRREVRPIEADARGFVLQLDGAGQSRKADGNISKSRRRSGTLV